MGDAVLDKSQVGQGIRQFHVGVAPGEVSTVALLPGDPFRVPMIAEHLTDVREVAHQREHRTMVGAYHGREITATSTGMGCPSTAIAVEELARVGVTSFIRVGSTGALQPGIAPGDLVVSEGSFRNDGTSAAYVPAGYPAVPDLEITTRLRQEAVQEAEGQSFSAHSGLPSLRTGRAA
jgi:uridine phosphorylase